MKTISLENNLSISLQARDGHFLGLGEVRCGGTLLRSGARPMFVNIRNPWAVQLCDYRLMGTEPFPGGGVRLTFAMDRVSGGPMDWHLHECRPMEDDSDWSFGPQPAAGTELALVVEPLTRQIDGRRAVGFSYRYEYTSPDIPIYKIEDRGTWEIGGSVLGNQMWLRNNFCPPLHTFTSADEHLSSEWYLDSCTNSNIFQFTPLQTYMQGFTMAVADAGALLTWCPQVSHIRTLIEKPRGIELLVHRHEHCGDLAPRFATAPMEVLFIAGSLNAVDRANLYGAMIELVYDTLHREAGIEREYVPAYGQIEEWTDADLTLYREQGLPALADAGMTYVEIANHCQNNMNTWGLANMCCTVDYKIAESVGEERVAAFCAEASARGVRVGMWANTSISALSWKFAHKHGTPKGIQFLPHEGSIMQALEKSKRPFVINSFGAIDADHYTPEFCVLNIRDAVVRDYWLKSWRHLAEAVGLGGIFLDSAFNLSSDKFDWRFNADPEAAKGATADQTHLLGGQRPAATPPSSIETMYHAHLSLMAAMQKLGYRYCGEDAGVFGMHRTGPALASRLDNLHLWNDFIAVFDAQAIRDAGADPDDVFFRGLAYRLMWALCWAPPHHCLSFHPYAPNPPEHAPRQWHFDLYRAYTAALPHMRRRRILPAEAGVVYEYEGVRVLWAFTDLTLPLGGPHRVENLTDGTQTTTATLTASLHRVYRIEPLITG